jgi:hypothetical protein
VVLNIAEGRGNDAGNARARFSTAHMATHLDEKLDEVCAITWCLGRRL